MIQLDLKNATTARLGANHGVDTEVEFKAWEKKLDGYVKSLEARRSNPDNMLGWIDLPEDSETIQAILEYARELDGKTDLVVLGIGGSSLGAVTVITALQHPYRNAQAQGEGLRVHFVDNVDPDTIHGLMEVLEPSTTLVNVISKSGATAETMAAYLAFKKWLADEVGDAYKRQIIATTDPKTGNLRPLAEREGYQTFAVPPSVGGRYSVLSAVGLLPIALAGIDIKELLKGAAEANRMISAPLADNPIKQAALVQYLAYRRGKPISVLMPYSTRLRALSDWFVQLWAESLGKLVNLDGSIVHEGSTPLGALGTTDQHSKVQLFNEGPNNKLVAFVRLANFGTEMVIPDSEPEIEELSYLAGQTFNKLINAEQAATAQALLEHGKPNYTLTLERLDAYHLGLLLQFLEWQTALMGEMTYINAYNQPGVELGKRYTYALMGRGGFEEVRRELAEAGVE
jgi:glucose-6-phosphate isomerase